MRSRAIFIAVISTILLGLLGQTASAKASEFPVVYDTSQITAGEQREVVLGNGVGGALKASWYSNPTYRCGRTGHFSLLVVEPSGVDATTPAPLWVMLHGGGTGYYAESGKYHKAEAMNDEEDIESLLDTLANKIQNNQGKAKDTVVSRRLDEGWRVMLPSMCDHDLYAGMGTPYPNNPNWGEEGDTVDGLLATMAAVDFTVRGNDESAGRPTGPVVLHGQSAGAVGAYAVAYALEEGGTRVNGAVMDAYLISERLGDLFDAGVTPQQQTDPEGDYEPNLEAKIGAFASDPALFPEQTVPAGFDVPLFDIVGSADPFCAGQFPAVPPAQAAGVNNNCEWVHQPLAEAIAGKPESLHRSLLLEGEAHQPTNRPGPVNDAVDEWLSEVLLANPAPPSWPAPPDPGPPDPGPPDPGPPAPPDPQPVRKWAKLTLLKQRVTLSHRKRVKLGVRCRTSGLRRCRGRIAISASKRALGLSRPGRRVIGLRTFTLSPGRRVATLRLNRGIGRVLKRKKSVPLQVRIVTRSPGKRIVVKRRVVLSRR